MITIGAVSLSESGSVGCYAEKATIQKRNSGWLFKKRNRCANLRDLDELFVHYITEVHRLYPSLFSVGTIMVMFSTWRLMCKGSILETAG